MDALFYICQAFEFYNFFCVLHWKLWMLVQRLLYFTTVFVSTNYVHKEK